jgi:5-formyltetrahydrofolate cyclo-ligase
MDKVDLRKALLANRRKIPLEKWGKINKNVVATLMLWPKFLASQTVMAYMAMKDEVSLQCLIEQAWKLGKTVAVPKMTTHFGYMNAVVIDPDTAWTEGAFGIKEPLVAVPVCPGNIELVFLSGVAFDHQGHRLGMGGGYYDRFLPQAQQAFLMGVTTDSQLVNEIPVQSYDCSVQAIVTESGIIYCNNSNKIPFNEGQAISACKQGKM